VEYARYIERIRSYSEFAELSEYGQVVEGGKTYPLLRLHVPGARRLVITAGFHGEEPAGPLTLHDHFPEIASWARARNVELWVYPCINPSGFESGERYNASGEKPNNDFLRYEIAPEQWRGELHPGEAYRRHELYQAGPKETRALRAELERHPAPAAALDLHQDKHLKWAATYAYVFGARTAYVPMVEASSRHAKIAARVGVDEHSRTDRYGLIHFHDGSVTDYFLRKGVAYTAALETTTQTPMVACHQINLIWVRGFIELAAGSLQLSQK
jgi:predicted deacylase